MKQKILSAMIIVMLSFITIISITSQNTKADKPEYDVPDGVEVGDIFLMDTHYTRGIKRIWAQPGPQNDHAAIYIGDNKFVHAVGNLRGSGAVQINNFTWFHSWAKNFAFARVTSASTKQKQDAIEFALSRIGDKYQVFFRIFRKIADPMYPHFSSKMWYCTEFVWASYYNQGIDIDRNGWFPFPRCAFVSGNDIIYDDDIDIYLLYDSNL